MLIIELLFFFVLYFCFDVFDGVCGFDIDGDGLSSHSLDEDLHSSSESEDQMKGGLFLDVVVGEGSAVFELLSSEDESLLIGWDAFLVLDLGLDILNGVCWLNIKGDCLSCEGLDENLHL